MSWLSAFVASLSVSLSPSRIVLKLDLHGFLPKGHSIELFHGFNAVAAATFLVVDKGKAVFSIVTVLDNTVGDLAIF
jgi:hypothetical protein